ncbi:TPA: streptodornase A [Streptococcus pyogenes]|uniref:streptodornase A n=1 Tax=Streptococcus pyogenes TaxID=1314 RepID=UPI00000D9A86|nr:streptodornase A [Streptococcus pyogenes]QBX20471.1 streptodornase D [Streptococcus phage Javan523]HER4721227.1 streptodornase A [Streptococcus pyogenes NGAS308]HER4768188.1 streptodornase A [Streptococcus pyogenes NGAS209]AAL98274.1 streptodornase [Streptococcus pyogenes MGAS8232]MDA6091004.1 streptodornase A [Streptococcus pyogenes]
MSKHWKHLFIRYTFTALATLFLGLFPISKTTNSIIYAETTDISNVWNIVQHPNYYIVEGKSHLNKEKFPQIYHTTEKVYRKSGQSTKRVTVSDIQYSILDGYGRSGEAYGVITKDMIDMSAGYREKWESKPEPSGWYSYFFKNTNQRATESDYKHSPKNVSKISNNIKASIPLSNGRTRHGYLFDRSHLIADSLGGRPFRNNLITGTRTQNVGNNDRKGGMQYIENKVLDHIKKNPKVHVYYKATPVYQGSELLPRVVLVSALSSDGTIDETVRVFNAVAGFNIDYQNGGLLTESPVSEIGNIEDSTTDEIENSVDDSEEIVYNDITTEEVN